MGDHVDMTAEQFWSLIGLILGVIIMSSVVYSKRLRKFSTLIFRLLLCLSFTPLTIVRFTEGDAFWAFLAWTSFTLALSTVLDALVFIGKELNEKLAASLMLVVVVAGGISANAYAFLMSTSFIARILSLSLLILIVAPTLMGLIAYSIGKRKLSKKLIKTLTLSKRVKTNV